MATAIFTECRSPMSKTATALYDYESTNWDETQLVEGEVRTAGGAGAGAGGWDKGSNGWNELI